LPFAFPQGMPFALRPTPPLAYSTARMAVVG